jgi:hypothetical protein
MPQQRLTFDTIAAWLGLLTSIAVVAAIALV